MTIFWSFYSTCFLHLPPWELRRPTISHLPHLAIMLSQLFSAHSTSAVPERAESTMTKDCILRELENQMKHLQHIQWEKEREEKQRKNIADYTWLAAAPPKYYEVPPLVQMELEDMCGRVLSIETGKLLERFRDLLEREPDVKEVPLILKAVINETIQNRAEDDSLLDVLRKRSFNTVRLRDKRVHPFNISEQVLPPTRRALSMPEFRTVANYSIFSTPKRTLPEFCAKPDDLPV